MIVEKKEKLTIILDASALKNSSCMLRMFYDVVCGYKEALPNNDTVFGSAFHTFRAHWRLTGDWFGAVAKAKKYYALTEKNIKKNKTFLTEGFLVEICRQYEEKYTNDEFEVFRKPDGVALIEPETRFAFPFYTDNELDILMAGTMDEMGRFRISKHFGICDVKTSAVWDIRTFMNSFKLNPQLLLYRWAVQKYAKFAPDSIWAEIESNTIKCFIDGIFYKKGTNDSGPSATLMRKDEFGSIDYIIFKQKEIDEFDGQVTKHILGEGGFKDGVKRWISTGQIPPRQGIVTDSCNTKFGMCKYAAACSAPDDEARKYYFQNNFITKMYNPMTFGEQP